MMRDIHKDTVGRWASLLPMMGVDSKYLTGKNCPCPFCGGKDRFRYLDLAGRGRFICNKCGGGTGFDLVMRANNVDFSGALKLIESHIGASHVAVKKAVMADGDAMAYRRSLWHRASVLADGDPVVTYLRCRGIDLHEFPTQLRYLSGASYAHDDGSKTKHDAMLAKLVGPDLVSWTLQITYLSGDGSKADVPKTKKTLPGKMPSGGAVRLAQSGEVLGIAEGVETALKAALLHGVPTWAALSAGQMQKFIPPATVKKVIVFGDNDKSFAGQAAAYGLAFRLGCEGVNAEVLIPHAIGTDWADA